MRRTKAFTLIELLVVISIIALLIALLLPVLFSARKQVEIIECANNLKQYTLGVQGYAIDNRGRLQSFYDVRNLPYPNAINFKNTTEPERNAFSVEAIQPYIKGFEFEGGSDEPVNRSAMCPSIDAEVMNKWVRKILSKNGRRWTEYSYCYWAVGPLNEQHNGISLAAKRMLPGGSMSEIGSDGGLIVSDVLYLDRNPGGWRYNHGKSGTWSFELLIDGEGSNKVDRNALPEMEGLNQGFLDGSVKWKGLDLFADIGGNQGGRKVGGGDRFLF